MHIICIQIKIFMQKKSEQGIHFLLTSYMAQRRMPVGHTTEPPLAALRE